MLSGVLMDEPLEQVLTNSVGDGCWWLLMASAVLRLLASRALGGSGCFGAMVVVMVTK